MTEHLPQFHDAASRPTVSSTPPLHAQLAADALTQAGWSTAGLFSLGLHPVAELHLPTTSPTKPTPVEAHADYHANSHGDTHEDSHNDSQDGGRHSDVHSDYHNDRHDDTHSDSA